MPVDHKRINGPEVSTPYIIYSKSNIKSNHENLYDILNLQKLRKDGRTPDKHRKVCEYIIITCISSLNL